MGSKRMTNLPHVTACRRWLSLSLLAISWLAAVSSPLVQAADEDAIGFVMDISGTWRLEGKKTKLAGGDKLPGGATVVPEQPGPKTSIVVCFYTGEASTYRTRTMLPARAEASWSDRIWSVIQGHYRGGIVHAVSRGDGIDDGVAQLDGQQLQLAPLLKNLPAGNHLFKFTPLADDPSIADQESAPPASTTLSLRWTPGDSQPLVAGQLRTGLYEVQLLNARSKQPTGAKATVLVATGAKFTTASEQFAKAVALTRTWDEATRAKASVSFLAAYLKALSEPEAL